MRLAVIGITVHSAELVQFRLRHSAEHCFMVSAVFLLPRVVYGLMMEDQLAKAIKLAPFSEVAGVVSIFSPPFVGGRSG